MIQDEVLILLDPNDYRNINYVTDSGDYFEFQQVATVNYEEEFFAILRSIDADTSEPKDEYVVFRIVFDGDSAYVLVEDDEEVVKGVYREYYRLNS